MQVKQHAISAFFLWLSHGSNSQTRRELLLSRMQSIDDEPRSASSMIRRSRA
jgi:hypothetical protein